MTRLTILLISLILCSFVATAQSGKTTISGQIDSRDEYIVLVRNIGYLGLTHRSDTIRVDKKHHFISRVKISRPENANISFGGTSLTLWLIPNSDVVLHLKDSTSQVRGAASDYAHYYLEQDAYRKKLYDEVKYIHPGYDKGTSLYSDQFFIITDSVTQKQFEFLDSYFSKKNLQYKSQFIDQERRSILYSNLFYKTAFPGSDIRKFKYFQDKLKIHSTYTYKYSDRLNMDDIRSLTDGNYQRFLTFAVVDLANQKIRDEGKHFNIDSYLDNAMAVIDTLSENKVCNLANKAIVLNAVVEDIQARKKIEWANKVYHTLAALSADDPNHRLLGIKAKLDATVRDSRFVKGAIAPDFTLADLSGKGYHLKDFKGKKVYIDIWATWCPHCIELEDDWNKLVRSYSKNPEILFLSVSMDEEANTWKRYIKKHPLEGIITHADGGVNGFFAKAYDINPLPHFILLDEDGKIHVYDAPAPNTPQLLKPLLVIKR